jgi:glycosyltransferase involved in cell wall biosynthesis
MEKKRYMEINERLRVTLIGHCYIAAENQKNLTHLAREVDLQTIVPKWVHLGKGEKKYGRAHLPDPSILVWQKPFYVFKQHALWPFGRLLEMSEPDIIHSEYETWSPITVEAAMLAKHFCPKARLVLTVKKNTYLPKNILLEQTKTFFRKRIDRRVSAYIATSEMARNLHRDWLGEDAQKFYICHHLGVDLSLFSPVAPPSMNSSTKVVVGYAGRLDPRKGIPELIEATRRLATQDSYSIKLRLLGKFGSLRHELEREAADLSWLSIEGPVDHKDVAPFLQGCDLFVFPSRNEPDHQEHDAHALMEAMAVGLPSVTTKSGIIPEIVDSQCALFVRENSPSDLSEKIAKLIKSPEDRIRMGRHARALAEESFGLETVAKRKVEIYKDIVNVYKKRDLSLR